MANLRGNWRCTFGRTLSYLATTETCCWVLRAVFRVSCLKNRNRFNFSKSTTGIFINLGHGCHDRMSYRLSTDRFSFSLKNNLYCVMDHSELRGSLSKGGCKTQRASYLNKV